MGETINAWAAESRSKPLVKKQVEKCQWNEDMIDMDVICCGVCGTDIHCIDEGWGPTEFPAVMGHEIIGKVTRVGKNVKHMKVGDRGGVGCQSGACLQCGFCKDHQENLCEKHAIWTFNDHYYNGDKTYGGFSETWRGHNRFVIKIPDNLESEVAASFLCGGVTTYAPLRRFNVDKNSHVGVLGVGGLGHFASQWAKAMGARVVGFDVIPEKAEDAKKLGCDDYVLMQKPEELARYAGQFTHVIATKVVNKCWSDYINLLRSNGVFILCDIPEQPLDGIPPLAMCGKQITIAATFIGPPDTIQECLNFASEKNIRTWVNVFPMDKINDAIQFVRDGKPRYRCVVKN